MKRLFILMLCIMVAVVLTACTDTPSPQTSETEVQSDPIAFTDEAFEAKVRNAMSRPEGVITKAEAAAITSLDLSNENFEKKDVIIRDISDIQYFTALEDLNLSFNEISDLTPLAEIKSLKTLSFSGISANDLSPLKGLTNMVSIVFCWNYNESQGFGFDNLDALSDMKNLEHIDAKNAGIKDISALANLPKIWDVQLCDNQITDITPLGNLSNLKIVLLLNNPIKDFSPLKTVYDNLDGKDFVID
jgi:Leucine-rich repeat (LRR) protein